MACLQNTRCSRYYSRVRKVISVVPRHAARGRRGRRKSKQMSRQLIVTLAAQETKLCARRACARAPLWRAPRLDPAAAPASLTAAWCARAARRRRLLEEGADLALLAGWLLSLRFGKPLDTLVEPSCFPGPGTRAPPWPLIARATREGKF